MGTIDSEELAQLSARKNSFLELPLSCRWLPDLP